MFAVKQPKLSFSDFTVYSALTVISCTRSGFVETKSLQKYNVCVCNRRACDLFIFRAVGTNEGFY